MDHNFTFGKKSPDSSPGIEGILEKSQKLAEVLSEPSEGWNLWDGYDSIFDQDRIATEHAIELSRIASAPPSEIEKIVRKMSETDQQKISLLAEQNEMLRDQVNQLKENYDKLDELCIKKDEEIAKAKDEAVGAKKSERRNLIIAIISMVIAVAAIVIPLFTGG